jgi:hypothetical protein
MKYTNLDLVQLILASMDSDEVNSVLDTTESQSVLGIVKTTYFDIASRANLPRHYGLFQLTASGSTARPVTMTVPTTIASVEWIKYNWATTANPELRMTTVTPLSLEAFLDQVMALNTNNTEVFSYVETVNGSQFTLLGQNNRAPHYYTTADDGTILFDSYDNTVDSTLQSSKTMCWGQRDFAWSNTDTFVPDLDDKQHQLLLNEAKALAFAELKQTIHPKAEKNARRQWIDGQSDKTKVPLQTAHGRDVNYGRR